MKEQQQPENLKAVLIRPADIILHCELNPTKAPELADATPAQLREACGIIPDFFADACMGSEYEEGDITLQAIADRMDQSYQWGGFCYPFGGLVTPDGTYCSEHADDPALPPLARFTYVSEAEFRFAAPVPSIECLIYQYAITAIRFHGSDTAMVARFD